MLYPLSKIIFSASAEETSTIYATTFWNNKISYGFLRVTKYPGCYYPILNKKKLADGGADNDRSGLLN